MRRVITSHPISAEIPAEINQKTILDGNTNKM